MENEQLDQEWKNKAHREQNQLLNHNSTCEMLKLIINYCLNAWLMFDIKAIFLVDSEYHVSKGEIWDCALLAEAIVGIL